MLTSDPRSTVVIAHKDPRNDVVASVHVLRAARSARAKVESTAEAIAPEIVLGMGPALVARTKLPSGVQDLRGLAMRLKDVVVSPRYSPAMVAIILHRAFRSTSEAVGPQVALHLIFSLLDEQLQRIGRGGLYALRTECGRLGPEWSEGAIRRIDEALAARGELFAREVDDTLLVCDGFSIQDRLSAWKQLYQRATNSASSTEPLAEKTVMLRPLDERRTARSLLVEHLRICLPYLPDTVAERCGRAIRKWTLVVAETNQWVRADASDALISSAVVADALSIGWSWLRQSTPRTVRIVRRAGGSVARAT